MDRDEGLYDPRFLVILARRSYMTMLTVIQGLLLISVIFPTRFQFGPNVACGCNQ
jgi:hypothetical protein